MSLPTDSTTETISPELMATLLGHGATDSDIDGLEDWEPSPENLDYLDEIGY